jgi:hypothetical protein
MTDHLPGTERRRYPRVKVLPGPPGPTAGLVALSHEREHSNGAIPRTADLDARVTTAGLPGESMLRATAMAGLGLAVCGGATFVAVRLVMVGAAWATGRSGDAVAT